MYRCIFLLGILTFPICQGASGISESESLEESRRRLLEEAHKRTDNGERYEFYLVGKDYEMGENVRQNYAESARWYKKSMDAGFIPAAAHLAHLFEHGLGCPTNLVAALRLYRKAATKNSQIGLLALGRFSDDGILMPVDKDDAAYWYHKVLSQFGVNECGAADEAAQRLVRIEGTPIPFPLDTVNGNMIADFLLSKTNRTDRMFATRVLRRELKGRPLTYTNLVVSFVQRLNDGGLNITLDTPNRQKKLKRWGYANLPSRGNSCLEMRVKVSPGNAKDARRLDIGDIVASFTGEVCDEDPWYWGFVFKGLTFTSRDPSVDQTLPEFDAEHITGDELLKFIQENRHRPIRKWQFIEMQSRLAGRRLTFHGLRLSGGWSHSLKEDDIWIRACPSWDRFDGGDETGRAEFALRFDTADNRNFAMNICQSGYSDAKLERVTGTFRKNVNPDDGIAFQLDKVEIVPQGGLENIDEFESGTIPGDRLMKKLGTGASPVGLLSVRHVLGERTISYSAAIVESTRSETNGTLKIFCRLPAPETHPQTSSRAGLCPLMINLEMPAPQVATLRRTPIRGDLLTDITGQIEKLPNLPLDGRNYGHARTSSDGALPLYNIICTPLWRSDLIEAGDLGTLTGDDLVRKAALCWTETRNVEVARILRQMIGRRIEFTSGIKSHENRVNDGNILFGVRLQDPLLGESFTIDLQIPPSRVRTSSTPIRNGTKLTRIRGILTAAPNRSPYDNAFPDFCLKDVEFTPVPNPDR